MDRTSLEGLAHKLLDLAAAGPGGRSASTVYGGREQILRQTLIALTAGTSLSEHESPGEAAVQVLLGRVRLLAGTDYWEGRRGDLMVIPQRRHCYMPWRTRRSCSPSQDGLTTQLPPSKPDRCQRGQMCSHDEVHKRLDLHNISIDFATAMVGRCGFTHLASGRTCQLPYRHRGACMLRLRQQPHRAAVALAAGHEPAASTQTADFSGHV